MHFFTDGTNLLDSYNCLVGTTEFRDDRADCKGADSGNCFVGHIDLVADYRGWAAVANCDRTATAVNCGHTTTAAADSCCRRTSGTCSPGHWYARLLRTILGR